jgi:hypothetical protein
MADNLTISILKKKILKKWPRISVWHRVGGQFSDVNVVNRAPHCGGEVMVFYWWQFECTEILWRDPEARCHAIHPPPSPCFSMIMHGPMSQGSVHNSRKLKMSQPAYSPDMSPIDHVWDALYRPVQQHVPVPANIQQLRTTIEREWDNILQTTINSLINSMWRRCTSLHEANGGHTRY